MSLVCGATTGDAVSVGSDASIKDLTTRTIMVWAKVTTLTDICCFFGSIGASVATSVIQLRLSGTGGNVAWRVARSTGSSSYITNDTPFSTSAWKFLAATYDEAATPKGHVYSGSLTTLATENSMGTASDGTGSKLSENSGGQVRWGNRDTNAGAIGTEAIQGSLDIGADFNRVLTLGEIQSFQFMPRVMPGCVQLQRFGMNGTGTQPDFSGTGNAGTVTGLTLGDPAPLPRWRRQPGSTVYVVAASGSTNWGPLLAQELNVIVRAQ